MAKRTKTKRTKRANGKGSIYQRASDGRWCGAVWVTVDGERKRKMTYGATETEVEGKVLALQLQLLQGEAVTQQAHTVASFARHWLVHTGQHYRYTTQRSYRTTVECYLIPSVGTIPLRALTAEHVEQMLDAHKGKLASATLRKLYTVTNLIMQQAFDRDYVRRNVVALVKAPTVETAERLALTPDQARRLLYAARGHKWEAGYQMAIRLGLRIGELLGLRWQDVDFEARRLHVRHSLSMYKGRVLQPPKTRASTRTLPLSPILVGHLHAHRARQLELQLQAGPGWIDGGFVFTTKTGRPSHCNDIKKPLKTLLKRTGLPYIPFHSFRHTCNMLLLSEGVEAKVRMAILGHSSVATTVGVYTHVVEGSTVAAMDALDRLLDGGSGDEHDAVATMVAT